MGKYLWLQNKKLVSEPNKTKEIDVYKIILTGIDLKEIPQLLLLCTAIASDYVKHGSTIDAISRYNSIIEIKSVSNFES